MLPTTSRSSYLASPRERPLLLPVPLPVPLPVLPPVLFPVLVSWLHNLTKEILSFNLARVRFIEQECKGGRWAGPYLGLT